MHVFHYVREHPIMTGALVIGVIVLIVVIRRGGSSSSAATGGMVYGGPSEGLQAAGLQASAQLQAAQIQANAYTHGLNAQVNIAELLTAGDVEKTRIAANVRLEEIFGFVDLTKYQTDAALKLGLAQVGAVTPSNYQPGSTVPAYTWGYQTAFDATKAAENYEATGWQIFGATQMHCDQSTVGGQAACAARNLSVQQAAYDAHPGSLSFLGDGVYSGTAGAVTKYGGYSGTDATMLAAQREYEKANYGYSWS